VELRGASSRKLYPKTSYSLETRDAAGRKAQVPLGGLPAGSDWALVACYVDKTCMRNALAYELAATQGRYAPRATFVEVIVDEHFLGLYLLVERISLARLELAEAAKDHRGDLTGGYLFRREGDGKGSGRDWRSRRGLVWTFHQPGAKRITAAQRAYLTSTIDRFEEVMAGEAWQDSKEGYPALLDEPSWVDYALLQELAHNIDAYWRSMYLYKENDGRGGRIFAGPVWDFDLAYGNASLRDGWRSDVWCYTGNERSTDELVVPSFWERLWGSPRFRAMAAARWTILRSGPFADHNIIARLEGWSALLAPAHARNDRVWRTLGRWTWPNWKVRSSFQSEAGALIAWIRARSSWMDRQLAISPEVDSESVGE
jgi:hypothetical protein